MSFRTARFVSDLAQHSGNTRILWSTARAASSSSSSSSASTSTSTSTTTSKPIAAKVPDPELEDDYRTATIVKPLSRPLGIAIPPIAGPKTYRSESKSIFDPERRKEERRVLLREASRGYFHDYNHARQGTGGKAWVAPSVLIREDKALYFPNIAGWNLLGTRTNTTELLTGKTTVLSILTTKLSAEHAESFVKPVLEDQADTPDFQYMQINHQSNYLKAALVSMFVASVKRTVPPHLWPLYLMAKGEWSELDINEPLGIENKILGYVYLIDQNCKVRWAGCGLAQEEEVLGLRTSTEMLIQRRGSAQGKEVKS